MDEALLHRFRQATDRENRRRPLCRRYSSALRQQAIEYWQQRPVEEGGGQLPRIGVSVTPLQRWTRGSARGPRFRPIAVIDSSEKAPRVLIQITPVGSRVEGLTVETAARLLTLLR